MHRIAVSMHRCMYNFEKMEKARNFHKKSLYVYFHLYIHMCGNSSRIYTAKLYSKTSTQLEMRILCENLII